MVSWLWHFHLTGWVPALVYSLALVLQSRAYIDVTFQGWPGERGSRWIDFQPYGCQSVLELGRARRGISGYYRRLLTVVDRLKTPAARADAFPGARERAGTFGPGWPTF